MLNTSKRFMKRWLLPGVTALCALGCEMKPPGVPAPVPPQRDSTAAPVAAAPGLTYLAGGAGVFQLSALKGQVVVLDLCAPWSPASRELVPELNRLWETHKGSGLTVVGLVVDADAGAGLTEELGAMGMQYPVVAAPRAALARLADMRAVPTRLLVDRKGQVRQSFPGYVSIETLSKEVESLLKE